MTLLLCGHMKGGCIQCHQCLRDKGIERCPLCEPIQNPNGWNLHWIDQGTPNVNAQVVPVGDLREHAISKHCWCKPELDDADPNVVPCYVHNSLDRREEFEPDGIDMRKLS